MQQTSTPLQFNLSIWLKAFALALVLLSPVLAQAQETIFKEGFGTSTSTSISSYQTAGGFNNSSLNFSGNASVGNTATSRSNYIGASSQSYIDLGSTNNFSISTIDTRGLTSLQLGFGVNIGAKTIITVEYQTSANVWQTLNYTLPAAGSGWAYITKSIPVSDVVALRFTASKSGGSGVIGKVLIDDVTLTGESSSPVITSFSPTSGGAGTEVTVSGNNLSLSYYVLFEASGAFAETYDNTTTSVKFLVPEGATTDFIQLYESNGETLVATSSSKFEVIAPTITAIAPKQGFVGDLVQIYGTNLSTATSVIFGGVGSATPTVIDDTHIEVVVPSAAKSGGVEVVTSYGSITSDISNSFTVLVPTISNITPAQGSPKPVGVQGDEVTITGNYLSTASLVTFGGGGSAVPHYTSEGTLRVYVPDDAETGTLSIATAHGTATSSTPFTVLKPKITSLSKNNGKEGQTISIIGQRLNIAPFSVTFGGGVTASVISSTATQLEVTVPVGAKSGVVTVTTAEGTAVTSNSFTVLKPTITLQNTPLEPFITKVGVASDPQFYTIEGSNLDGSINITVPSQFELSKDNGATWSTGGITFPIDANGTVTQKYVFVRYNPSAKGTHSGYINNTSVSLTQLVAVSGSTLDPTITVSGTLSEFTTEVGTPSASQSYTVSGVNMEGGIAVAAPATGEFKVSLDNATFTRTVFVPLPGGSTSIAETTVYVRYEPTEAGTHSGNIVQSSTNATDVSVSASGNTSKGTLPVELVSFKAERHGSEVTLLWATASEQDNSHFEVEMANSPSAGFRSIGRVNSKAGSSAITTNYLLKYSLPGAGTRYFRLKQVDVNGTFTYSKVVAVEMEAAASLGVTVAPNPLNYNSKVLVQAHAGGKATVSLHNLAGKRLYHQTTEVKEGQNELQLPLYDQLPNGLYILTVELKGQRQQVKVVKQ